MRKIHQGDAYALIADVLASIPDHLSVAIVTDPPYLFNNSGGGKFRKARSGGNTITNQKMDKGFDDQILFSDGISSVVCFMHNDQVFDLGVRLKQWYHRAVICQDGKKNPSPMANKNYRADSEIYIHAWHKQTHPVGMAQDKLRITIHGRDKEKTGHPAQKPLDLMRKIVRTVNADVIIDPFAGSGTTLVACMLEGKNFIGIEKDPEYFEIAKARLIKAAQTSGT